MERSTLSRRQNQSASSVRGSDTRKNEGNHSSRPNYPYQGNRYSTYALIRVLTVMVAVMIYFLFDSSGVNNSSSIQADQVDRQATIVPATSTKVDFTYGTILAGLNSPVAYSQLESTSEQNIHPLVHHEDSVDGIRVCIITNEYFGIGPSGGIGHVLYELTRLLSERNAIMTVVYLGKDRIDDEIVRDHAARGISIVRAPHPKIKIEPNHISLRDSYKALHFLMESEAKNDLFDIIHFNDYLGHALFPLYAKKQGWLLASSKVVITLHGTGSWTRLANGMTLPRNLDDLRLDWCEMQAISLADYICAPSRFIATYVLSHGTKIGGNLFHIGNAPPSAQSGNAINHDKATHTNTKKISEIVFFGRVEYRKGLDLFIKGLDLFASGHPGVLETMKVTFLGSITDSGQRTVNQAQSSSKNLGRTVFNFVSTFDRDQAMAYIQHPTRLIVIPSLTENFPGTVFECIEVGASFIASDVGGIPEMIHPHDRNATLFRPLPKDLARRLTDRIVNNQSKFHYTRHAILPAQIQSDILSFHNLVYNDLQRDVKPPKSSYHPRVTVCMTHYERPLVLLESLKRIQLQSYSNFDVIVVDDGSESVETRRVLEENVAPFMHRYGWKLVIANHAYLGAARNLCAGNTKSNTDYIFFMDEDDAIAQEALQALVDTAQHANADIVTSFFNYFKDDNPVPGKSTRVLMFSGGSPTMGILSNVFGGSMLLISRGAFFDLGGFTEFDQVGHEDYELHMKAVIKGLRSEVIPRDDLFFIHQTEDSMSAKMDPHLAFYRSMSPLLNEYPGLQDAFTLVQSLNFRT